ncbi:arylsulfatase J-like [Lingula anatina]|uniref:Arylsulfatase J-like n=1 Tax=Lingula anatina TaxID=7574 RepID=A0A1S3KHF7_LINAN|nr:arylsulfatase J-like [Lingula anatina]|eukprot:XP_013422063.1 arylsulfatase J-like [Lingula anatina]
MVSALDKTVSDIVKSLIQQGMLENSVIVFSSDNGGAPKQGADNAPYRGIKGSLWEGGIKVPVFVWSKLLQRPGRTARDLITITDWCPTLLGLAGVDVKNLGLDGFDVWDTLSSGKTGHRYEVIHELISPSSWYPPRGRPLYNDTFDTTQRASLRRGDWKIITGTAAFVTEYVNGEPVELEIIGIDPSIQNVSLSKNVWLYNITKDPYEQYDVSEKYPDVVRLMLDRLETIRQMAPPTIWPGPDPALNAATQNGVWGPAVYPTSGSTSESANRYFWLYFLASTAFYVLM